MTQSVKFSAASQSKGLSDMIARNKVRGEEQNGFRRGRRGEDNVYVVHEVIERPFLIIKKANNSVVSKMCKALGKAGMSDKITKIIGSKYEDTKE